MSEVKNPKVEDAKLNKQFLLGYRLAYKSKARTKPWKKIFSLWKAAAEAGHIRTQFYLGVCYDNELGTRKNLTKAFIWFLKAAESGKMEAEYNIGYFYR
jgi:TPR repeat protein